MTAPPEPRIRDYRVRVEKTLAPPETGPTCREPERTGQQAGPSENRPVATGLNAEAGRPASLTPHFFKSHLRTLLHCFERD